MTPQEYVLYLLIAVCGVLLISYPLFHIIFAAYFDQKLRYHRQLLSLHPPHPSTEVNDG